MPERLAFPFFVLINSPFFCGASQKLIFDELSLKCAQKKESVFFTMRHRHLVLLHVSHGGGTWICEQARLNNIPGVQGKRFTPGLCNAYTLGDSIWKGDGPFHKIHSTCFERKLQLADAPFSQVERFLDADEVCSEFDYVLFMRHPLDRVESYLLTHAKNRSLVEGKVRHLVRSHAPCKTTLSPFANFWDGNGLAQFDNPYVRMISMNGTLPMGMIGKTQYQLAVRNVKTFAVAKPLQSAADALTREPFRWIIKNATKNPHAPPHGRTDTNSYLGRLNKWDMMLYAYLLHRKL